MENLIIISHTRQKNGISLKDYVFLFRSPQVDSGKLRIYPQIHILKYRQASPI